MQIVTAAVAAAVVLDTNERLPIVFNSIYHRGINGCLLFISDSFETFSVFLHSRNLR
jgi:hypothetical protein